MPLSEAPFTDQGGDCEFPDYFFCISLTPGEWVSLHLPAKEGRTLGLGLVWRLPEPPAPGRKERGSPSWQLWVPAGLFPAPVIPRSPASLACGAWRCRFIHTSALHSSSLLCPRASPGHRHLDRSLSPQDPVTSPRTILTVPQNVTLPVALTPTKALLDPAAQGFSHSTILRCCRQGSGANGEGSRFAVLRGGVFMRLVWGKVV